MLIPHPRYKLIYIDPYSQQERLMATIAEATAALDRLTGLSTALITALAAEKGKPAPDPVVPDGIVAGMNVIADSISTALTPATPAA